MAWPSTLRGPAYGNTHIFSFCLKKSIPMFCSLYHWNGTFVLIKNHNHCELNRFYSSDIICLSYCLTVFNGTCKMPITIISKICQSK